MTDKKLVKLDFSGFDFNFWREINAPLIPAITTAQMLHTGSFLGWTDKYIEAYFGSHSADSEINVLRLCAWPFGNLTCEEAKMFRDLLKKIIA